MASDEPTSNSGHDHGHDRRDSTSDNGNRRINKRSKFNCFDQLINCAIVILPSMFVLPVLIYVLEKCGFISGSNGTKVETLLSYYFVLCWATMFIFSFLFCTRSLFERDIGLTLDLGTGSETESGRRPATTEASSPSVHNSSSNYPSDFTTISFDENNDLPPSYEEATGIAPYI